MKKPIRICDHTFASKKAATEFVREILYGYTAGQSIDAEDEDFMRALFERHPEYDMKRGVGIDFITVERNLGSMGFWLTRVDASKTDISFIACLSPPSHASEVRTALRTEVRGQIVAFKAVNLVAGARCQVTGDVLGSDAHVDHDPPFESHVQAFVAEHGGFDRIAVEPTADGETDTRLLDRAIADEWQAYHAVHAGLRLVTAHANLSLLRRTR